VTFHQDIFDLKMDAPKEIRGDFRPISTKVPGIQICEHLPRLAKMMDKLVLIHHGAAPSMTSQTLEGMWSSMAPTWSG